jgi:hypothetical protein
VSRSRVKGLLSLLIAVMALIAVAPAAASASGSISGTVTAASGGSALKGVEVCAESSLHRVCVRSGDDGKYTFAALEEGDYEVNFRPAPQTNYLYQAYPEKAPPEEGEPIPVLSGQAVTGIDAKLKSGGQISGRVTDAGTGVGIKGIAACASRSGSSICGLSNANGDYVIVGLQTNSFTVYFDPAATDYIFQAYKGITDPAAEGTPVPVTAGAVTAGIDDTLTVGASISGRVTDAATGAGLEGIYVCVTGTTISEFFPECEFTGGDGVYKVRGLLPGTYEVVFSEEPDSSLSDGYDTQFFDGKATIGEATALTLSGGQAKTGVDAHLNASATTPPSGGGGGKASSPPPPITSQPLALISPPAPVKKLVCKKGSKKKKIKGKTRCVKKKVKKKH